MIIMKKTFREILITTALFTLPLALTSCEDILGHWEKPTPADSGIDSGIDMTNKFLKWNGSEFVVSDIPEDAVEITNTSTTFGAGMYFVKGNVSLNSVTFTGDAELILCEGATLTVADGFASTQTSFMPTYSLTIYGQGANTGKLITNAATTNNSILFKNLTIYGGDISAKSTNVSAIKTTSDLIIGGGIVSAEGGPGQYAILCTKSMTISGASTQISAKGNEAASSNPSRGIYAGVDFTLNDGTITATGGKGSSESGYYGGDGLFSKSVIINGGTLNATGGDGVATNVNGGHGVNINGGAGQISINGGLLLATGGSQGTGTGIDGQGINGTINFGGSITSAKGCTNGTSWDTDLVTGNTSNYRYIKIQ